ncbi:SAM-dependent methyltransferase [candidate division WOR-3 bacterium]|nr:SAM-dependent methyltransferase [candidate division WOR-3 bacterium]
MQLLIIFAVVFVLYVAWKYWTLLFGAGYDPTPMDKVRKMLTIAEVREGDIVYDLGCGDARFLITAARLYKARGVGIELDPFRFFFAWVVKLVSGQRRRVRIRFGNFFGMDISSATVIALFLYGPTNERLKSKFKRELRPGTRIVSYIWQFEGWELLESLPEDRIYLYKL